MKKTLDDFAGSPITGLRIRRSGGEPYESGYTILTLLELKRARPSCRRRILDELARVLHKSNPINPHEIHLSFEGGDQLVESFSPSIAAGQR